ncbi:MAG: hypothetical protein IAC78_00270 [Firmicutes bacterium]|uniref:Uncharacterized protein n=1 Tax=Candidatus Scatoplasma merdavium TaxID=2840932 RepID=A0A9D9D4J4_9BACL|nr:hypothetical protein [Candidatus Scatoplasma merdavium]
MKRIIKTLIISAFLGFNLTSCESDEELFSLVSDGTAYDYAESQVVSLASLNRAYGTMNIDINIEANSKTSVTGISVIENNISSSIEFDLGLNDGYYGESIYGSGNKGYFSSLLQRANENEYYSCFSGEVDSSYASLGYVTKVDNSKLPLSLEESSEYEDIDANNVTNFIDNRIGINDYYSLLKDPSNFEQIEVGTYTSYRVKISPDALPKDLLGSIKIDSFYLTIVQQGLIHKCDLSFSSDKDYASIGMSFSGSINVMFQYNGMIPYEDLNRFKTVEDTDTFEKEKEDLIELALFA